MVRIRTVAPLAGLNLLQNWLRLIRGRRTTRRPQLPGCQRHHDPEGSTDEHVARVVGVLAHERPVNGRGGTGERKEQQGNLLRRPEREGQVGCRVSRRERGRERAGGVQSRSARVAPADDGPDGQVGRRRVACTSAQARPAALRQLGVPEQPPRATNSAARERSYRNVGKRQVVRMQREQGSSPTGVDILSERVSSSVITVDRSTTT